MRLSVKRPKLLDQPVVEFPRPFAAEESLNGFAAGYKLGCDSATGCRRIGERDLGRIARCSSRPRRA